VLTLCPSMTISRAQLDRALDIVEAGSQALG
jgi:4-aminobutyrate aminotransferase-like enzyme